MQDRIFAITDIETTGGGINGNCITEICIALVRNGEVIDKYSSLVNPRAFIPPYITALTGIDNTMVEDAPTFEEIAAEIDAFTQDTIFVAHNVSFDYEVLRNEFKNVGIQFSRRRLCTVRLARKLIPNLLSYSLGRLCDTLSIPHFNRHRAEGDVDATVILFSRLFSLDDDFKVFRSFLNQQNKQATLPPHLPSEQIEQLPQEPGIYFFKNQKQKVIYVGKAKNIKKRVLSHFYDKNSKEYHLGQETYFIDFEETGNELIALLTESENIRSLYPKYNRAQKRPTNCYQIIRYTNRLGIIQLALGKTRSYTGSGDTFYSRTEAVEALENLCREFNLCPRFCGLQQQVDVCSHYQIKSCEGICEGKESVEKYNLKVEAALNYLFSGRPTYVIHGAGRTKDEVAFVMVVAGIYKGYGFFDRSESFSCLSDYEPYLKLGKSGYHTDLILRQHLRKNGEKNLVYYENQKLDFHEIQFQETLFF
ncbi:MAG TPA: exonuclease domain-containing protein [Flavobacteriaceae bacterium]|nr:exonuclease domain-containing protein [Flavobacteriaceae bacterium]